MRPLDELEYWKMHRMGKVTSSDEADEPDDAGDTALLDAVTALSKQAGMGIAELSKALAAIADKLATPAPTPAAPKVTVNIPKRGTWTATVAERDKDGMIKRVTFAESNG